MKTKRASFLVTFALGIFFLFSSGKVSAAGGVGMQATATTQSAITSIQSATTLTELNTAVQSFLNQYSVTYSTAAVPDTSTFSTSALASSDFSQAQSFDIELVQEWSKYTATWVSASNLQTIYAVTNLHVLPLSMASSKRCASYGQGSNHYVLYDVDCSNNDSYMREAIHHEYAHYLLEQENGGTQPVFDESTWGSYNPAGFNYGGGGQSCYTIPSPCPIGDHAVTGFASGYATTSIYEDQAETYAYLFATSNYQNLTSWIPADTVLNNKVNLMKSYISSIDPTMDNTYIQNMNTYAAANNITVGTPFAGPGIQATNPDTGTLVWTIPANTDTGGSGIGIGGDINQQVLVLDGTVNDTCNP